MASQHYNLIHPWRRSNQGSSMIIITIIILVTCTNFLIGVPSTRKCGSRCINKNICVSRDCVHAANDLLQNIDETVDPCDNFFEFACGKLISEKHDYYSVINDYQKLMDAKLLYILLDGPEEDEPKVFQKTKNIFQSCLNKTKIDIKGTQPLLDYISEFGKWPVLDKTNNMSINFEEYNMENLTKIFTMCPDDEKKEVSNIGDYYEYMVKVVRILGADEDIAKRDMLDVLNLKQTLCDTDKYEINQSINIHEIKNHYLSNGDDIVIMFFKTWYDIIQNGEILSDLNRSNRTIVNLMIWLEVEDVLPYSIIELHDLYYEIHPEEKKSREMFCLYAIKESDLAYPLSSMYVRKHYTNLQNDVYDIFTNMKSEAKHFIENLEWLDEETREEALKKLFYMNANIGGDKENDFFKSLNDSHLTVTADSFFESYINLENLGFETQIPQKFAVIINAMSNPYDNTIYLPSTFIYELIKPYVRPKFMDYATLGFTIGHETFHQYDTNGIEFDAFGNSRKWYKNNKNYEEKVDCIVDKYSNYKIEEFNTTINGKNTMGENIADLVGIKVAYNAYIRWTKENRKELLLPGLNYTQNQLFWISFASPLCSTPYPPEKKDRILGDEHSPNKIRVLGVVSNTNEFSEDFKCPPGSNMNPIHKCNIEAYTD